jgi:hypothetical protein
MAAAKCSEQDRIVNAEFAALKEGLEIKGIAMVRKTSKR